MNGVCGKILIVNLTDKTVERRSLEDSFYEKYLAGVGLAAAIIHELIPPKADPLGPENVLGFTSGMLTGSGAFFSGRWQAVTKSPLTGTWGEANGGGDFSPAIKRCGVDAIFLQGIAAEPTYLVIDENQVLFENAAPLWGKDIEETENWLKTKHGKRKTATVTIGEAGENVSLIAGIVNDSARLAARAGVGAVMGSKKVKAILLHGRQRLPQIDNHKKIIALNRIAKRYVWNAGPFLPALGVTLTGVFLKTDLGRMITNKFMSVFGSIIVPTIYKKWGTTGLNLMSMKWGDAPSKNWQGTVKNFSAKQQRKLHPNKIIAKQSNRYYCYACPLGCGGTCEVTGHKPKKVHKPEFESVMALGPLLGIDDLDFLIRMNHRLNMAGLDTISAGGTIAFAMESYQRGLINEKDTQSLELQWGNQKVVEILLEQMIKREGFGATLTDGSKVAAEKIGKMAMQYAMHAGGQEMAMHDPRLDPGFGLHASVDPNPGKHTTGSYLFYHFFRLYTQLEDAPRVPLISNPKETLASTEENAKKSVLTSNYFQILNASGVCMFGAFFGSDRLRIFDYLNAVTGWEKTPQEYMQIGHRIQTLRQMFNIREGINPWQNQVNPRLTGTPPQKAGPNKARSYDIDALMQNYWQEIGWDPQTGIPLPETINSLGLKEFQKS